MIELLAVLFVVSLVFGISFYYIGNVINHSSDTSDILSVSGIKKSANLYVREFADDIVWDMDGDNKTICINVNDLIKKGYIKKDSDTKNYNSIRLTKNANEVITKEEVSEKDCQGNSGIEIPTAEYCSKSQLTYNGSAQTLANVPTGVKAKNNLQKAAGNHKVTFTLSDDDTTWKDGTKGEK